MFKSYTFLLMKGFFLVLFSMSAQARTDLSLGISINTAPPPVPPNIVMLPPQGYSNCYMTPGEWIGKVWVPPHQECAYPGAAGALWVSGYWGCVAFDPIGACRHWQWYSHRWVKGPQMRRYYGYGGSYHRHHW